MIGALLSMLRRASVVGSDGCWSAANSGPPRWA